MPAVPPLGRESSQYPNTGRYYIPYVTYIGVRTHFSCSQFFHIRIRSINQSSLALENSHRGKEDHAQDEKGANRG